MKIIIVTGTPCTGKTTVAKIISRNGYGYVDVNKMIKKEKLNTKFDKKRDCYIVDEQKLKKALEKKIKDSKKNLVIDSHMSHFASPKLVDLCVVTKCSLKELKKRLNKRKYGKEKIEENMEAEIMGVCLNEAKELGHNVVEVDTSSQKALKLRLKNLHI